VAHLLDNRFEVKNIDVHDEAEMMAVKARYGVPNELASCHTAIVDGYVVEGHVPADVIMEMLRERPQIKGLSVLGMPIGSPGMEDPRRPKQPYNILAFDAAGKTKVYASR
jgi:hypothetical protein